jgi:hypothetical protein
MHSISYHVRKPTSGDMDKYQQTVPKNMGVANRNLIVTLVFIEDEKNKLLSLEDDYPGILSKVVEGFLPLFGMVGEAVTTKV